MKSTTTFAPNFRTFIFILSIVFDAFVVIGGPTTSDSYPLQGRVRTEMITKWNKSIISEREFFYQVPFHFRMKMMIIEVVVDRKKGFFVLDTGLDHLVLNGKYFSGSSSGLRISGINTDITIIKQKTTKVKIGNIPVYKTLANLANIDFLEQILGIQVLGVCGVDFLMRYQWIIDYKNKVIYFLPLDKNGELLETTLIPPGESIQLGKKGHLLYMKANIGTNTLKMVLDTGAGTTLLDKKFEKRLQGYLKRKNIKHITNITGISGIKRTGYLYELTDFIIGSLSISKTRVTLCSINTFLTGNRIIFDGVYNPILLRRELIELNWKKQQLYIWDESFSGNSEIISDGELLSISNF